ncbi:DUF3892 domain-containing protein [Bradyrhizobium lablabi]|uniref:DUF3892 domain-containing protein n=1 Tax=Bradyrhizobium lablabi TaxID=722472 RepID=UPI001BA656D6|nr:DUF3892 domain-containing protein [Bradyrhizobium lablabi]MBR0693466.1 DUF3892 domain-containing protein [Bradyrhizobium lablabi]
MAARVEIQCSTKRPSHHDPHDRIQGVGGVHNGARWWLEADAAIGAIESGTYCFFVSMNEKSINVVVATNNGCKYLNTSADGYAPNNLLNLPDCPR